MVIAPGGMIDGSTEREIDRETPVADSSESPTQRSELLKGIRNWCDDAYERARAGVSGTHDKWAAFQDLKDGRNPGDDPNDPMVRDIGVYFPILARLSDVARANLLNKLIPDQGELDFFTMSSRFEGLGRYGRMWTGLMRDKFRGMRPADANYGFPDVLDRQIDDWLGFGNFFGTGTHDVLYGDGSEILSEGPVIEWLDPFNVYPVRLDVNNINQTDVFVYSPIDDAELDQLKYPEEVKRRVFEKGAQTDLTMRDSRSERRNETHVDGETILTDLDPKYPRRVYFGKFPVHELFRQSKKMLADDGTPKEWFLSQVEELAATFGFDPMDAIDEEGNAVRWWHIEWIDEEIGIVEPYPLKLPKGRGPIIHDTMFKRNGQLLGYGLYDRGQWDERFYNFFMRALLTLAGLQAYPPFWYEESSIDPEWIQKQGGDWSLEAAMAIPVIPGAGKLPRPIEPIQFHERTISLLGEASAFRENSMRELTGITSAVEGDDNSDTATQSANNLQQSLMLMEYLKNRLAHGALRDMVVRAYVIEQQAMSSAQFSQWVPLTNDEMTLATVQVRPEHLVNEAFLTVNVTSASTFGNRQSQVEMTERFMDRWVPMGVVNIPSAARVEAKLKGIPSVDEILQASSMDDIQRMIQNAMFYLGGGNPQGAIQMLPSYVQQLLVGAPMQGGGGRAGGGNAAVGQQGGNAAPQPGQTGGNAQSGGVPAQGAQMQSQTSGGAPAMTGGVR